MTKKTSAATKGAAKPADAKPAAVHGSSEATVVVTTEAAPETAVAEASAAAEPVTEVAVAEAAPESAPVFETAVAEAAPEPIETGLAEANAVEEMEVLSDLVIDADGKATIRMLVALSGTGIDVLPRKPYRCSPQEATRFIRKELAHQPMDWLEQQARG